MIVKELIEALSKEDPEKRVVISGYEGGYKDIEGIGTIKLKLNVNTAWYYGPHEATYGNKGFDEEAILI